LPLDHPWFSPDAPPVILAVGRLTAVKDYPTLLRAFALLRQWRAARLFILGEGELRRELGALAETLGIAADVQFAGFDPNPYRYMKRSAVLALSSAWEGFGNVLVEALACGTQVVATDCPSGPAEILAGGKFGRLVPVGDAAALAQAIESALLAPLPPDALTQAGAGFFAGGGPGALPAAPEGRRGVRLKIAHVATGLGVGGAEMALLNLLSCLDRQTFECEVFSLSSEAPLAERLRALGVPVHILGMKPGLPDPRGYLRLVRGLRRFRPDLIQTWMYHADLLGGLAAPLVGKPPVVWGLHLTLDEMSAVKAATPAWSSASTLTCHPASRRPLSAAPRLPARRTPPSATTRRGCASSPTASICTASPPTRQRGRACAPNSACPPRPPLIGMAARFHHPFKDHRNFFQAAAILHALRPEVHFVLWGKDITMENPDLAAWCAPPGWRA
jgi:glycosyltransferase involved in cell wall biosynthesis